MAKHKQIVWACAFEMQDTSVVRVTTFDLIFSFFFFIFVAYKLIVQQICN